MESKKLKTQLPALLLLVLTAGIVNAQDSSKVTYGIKVGINNNSTTRSSTFDEVNPPKMKNFRSYSVTVIVDVPLTSVLSVQPGLELTTKGQQKGASTGGSDDVEYRVTYLQAPINLIAKYRNFFLGAGGYFARALKGTYESGSVKDDLKFGSSYISSASKKNDDWEQYDYGASMLFGYKLKKFTFNVNYQYGLKDIDPNPYYRSKNRGVSLELGFIF
ncbi:PorT family protein [Arcticibacter tournemirensis]|uniref:PorT family protein n=1 Tax=Arcticibacter tournemirensis TaxID=699437 RepID=A0A5M9H942_9SPHI|nr:outer membrane beta-barrel protein [Arcticibacter tournemirensis]KAA8482725.1 PorT family protein [Arcticibacter tournemirensis]